jgi:hypothetical protein
MTTFHQVSPSLENYFRAVILFGQNTASYKFALGKALIELSERDDDFVPLDVLATYFSKHISEHVALAPKQSTRSGKVKFFDLCERYNSGEADQDELIEFTIKNAFNDVIDRFHIVNQEDIEKQFYIDERKSNKGIRLTNDLRKLVSEMNGIDLLPEIESRWRLVETAWDLNISRNLIAVSHDEETQSLYVGDNLRRKNITSSRDALNGYQKGKCFFCFDRISVNPKSEFLAHVDHFFPHVLKDTDLGQKVDGIWNLVLACQTCNGSGEKGAKVPHLTLVERLDRRNEYLLESNHPLKETILGQTGMRREQRISFIQDAYEVAIRRLVSTWQPIIKGSPAF